MKLHEECGVFACYTKNNNAFDFIKYGLSLLQHRGQESAGITAGDIEFVTIKDTGLVCEVFKNKEPIKGYFGIGHVRYSTSKLQGKEYAQPFCKNFMNETAALAHNGNIPNKINDITDSELILKTLIENINKKPSQWSLDDITKVLYTNFKDSAWSIVMALPEKIAGIKDPSGFHPLMFCIAEEGMFIASEDCAFTGLNIKQIIEIQNGEYIEITKNGYKIEKYCKTTGAKQCVFEQIYFANPASKIFSRNVYETRVELGRLLAKEDNTKADVIIPVMSSGLAAAIGYSEISKIPMHLGLKKNKAIRSFIEPKQQAREKATNEKYMPIKSVIENNRIILVDDSIVRGTTMKHLTKLLKQNGAKEIHIRLSSPAIINSCFWGIDIPDKNELISRKYQLEQELADYFGADDLKYISIKSFKKLFDTTKWCYNCFNEDQEY